MPLHDLPEAERRTPFTASDIWRAQDVTVQGTTRRRIEATVSHHFCPTCGSSVFGFSDGEVAIGLGAFDQAPTDLVPTYELFTARRRSRVRR